MLAALSRGSCVTPSPLGATLVPVGVDLLNASDIPDASAVSTRRNLIHPSQGTCVSSRLSDHAADASASLPGDGRHERTERTPERTTGSAHSERCYGALLWLGAGLSLRRAWQWWWDPYRLLGMAWPWQRLPQWRGFAAAVGKRPWSIRAPVVWSVMCVYYWRRTYTDGQSAGRGGTTSAARSRPCLLWRERWTWTVLRRHSREDRVGEDASTGALPSPQLSVHQQVDYLDAIPRSHPAGRIDSLGAL